MEKHAVSTLEGLQTKVKLPDLAETIYAKSKRASQAVGYSQAKPRFGLTSLLVQRHGIVWDRQGHGGKKYEASVFCAVAKEQRIIMRKKTREKP